MTSLDYELFISGMRSQKFFNGFYVLAMINGRSDEPLYHSPEYLNYFTFLSRNILLPPLIVNRTIEDILIS